MFSIGKLTTRSWQVTLIIFLTLFLQSCGVPGSDSTLKEKNVAAGDASVAYKKEAVDMKEAKRAGTERATFALG
jgi:hypothetical protein